MSQAGAAKRAHGTAWLTMLAARVAAFAGWRRYGCAAALGALAVAAMPPWHLIVVLPVAFSGLVWLIDGCGAGRRQTGPKVGSEAPLMRDASECGVPRQGARQPTSLAISSSWRVAPVRW